MVAKPLPRLEQTADLHLRLQLRIPSTRCSVDRTGTFVQQHLWVKFLHLSGGRLRRQRITAAGIREQQEGGGGRSVQVCLLRSELRKFRLLGGFRERPGPSVAASEMRGADLLLMQVVRFGPLTLRAASCTLGTTGASTGCSRTSRASDVRPL